MEVLRRIVYLRHFICYYGILKSHVESSVIFETLYLLLVFGFGNAEQDVLDPPEDCFRIRLVITLLQTCGHYFDRGSSKRKLDRFLIHFQRYILEKGSLPLDLEFDLQVRTTMVDLLPTTTMRRHAWVRELRRVILQKLQSTSPLDEENCNNYVEFTKPCP
ncbi:hypothetical protein MLD38_040398 [Melastoma candidum]|uniref:Uncharacterized protein n=1 Tax=Melastoma candidum TaxID=119954 RepID=A0ACB9L683_9MYRT|nr:hypothetical protein MLD38_040398 [Melastoma candidum]